MSPEQFEDLRQFVVSKGYADDIYWSENLRKCDNYSNFFEEAAWVICNSGMKNQVARKIYWKIIAAILDQKPASTVFNHKGKAQAIEYIWKNKEGLFGKFLECKNNDEILSFLKTLPWIGDITKYHLAKNLGMDVCKPDRHLSRIADMFKTTPEKLCQKLSKETGARVATVDYVIWRAANLGKV